MVFECEGLAVEVYCDFIPSHPHEFVNLIFEVISSSKILWGVSSGDLYDFELHWKTISTRQSTLTDSERAATISTGAVILLNRLFYDMISKAPHVQAKWNEIFGNPALRTFDKEMILTAALISCGLGANAWIWAYENLTPVLVKFRGKRCLGLVPDLVFKWDSQCEFFLVASDSFFVDKAFVLLARHSGREPIPLYTRCLFPYDIVFEEQ